MYAYCTLERSAKLAQKVHGCNNLELVPTTIWVARERSKIEDQCDDIKNKGASFACFILLGMVM